MLQVIFTQIISWHAPSKIYSLFKDINLCYNLIERRYLFQLEQTADSDPVSTSQVSSVQLLPDKKLKALNKAEVGPSRLWDLD